MGDKARVVALLRIRIAQLLVERDGLFATCREIAGMETPHDAESPKHFQAYLYHEMRKIASAAITDYAPEGEE